jgi:cytoskeletal protein CcmA (bactofilin family)
MAQIDYKDPAATPEATEKLRFEGTIELGGNVAGEMLGVLFSEESNVNGTLKFQGSVQINGTFRGAVTTNDVLIVGERATIEAEITCGSVVVKGDVTGNIKARDSVALHTGAHVRGDITSPALSVDKGAMFDGTSRMGTSPSKRRSGRS